MVPVVKGKNDVRICVDLRKLNKCVMRERFIMPTIDEMLPKLAGAKMFSKLDAHSGFYQIPLDKESHKLTTFITPMGRYCFRRLPFGISSAPEIFQRTMSDLFSGMDGVSVLMDDVLVFRSDRAEHDARLKRVLEILSAAGLKLNSKKCKYRQSEVEFYGHEINGQGICPSKGKVEAIVRMEPPPDVTGLRRLMGMVNYLGRFLPELATVASPLNGLMRADSAWLWGPPQEEAFARIKELISNAPVLAFYDVNRPTVVSADASQFGIGGALLQEYPTGLKPVAYFSRSLSASEYHYAQIEKECLAGVSACEKFEMYLVGIPSFRLLTDHKPLVPLINKKDIDQTPIRCQRLLTRMMRFNVEAVHTPGKNLVISDTLSRSPVKDIGDREMDLEREVEAYVGNVRSGWPATTTKLEEIRQATREDPKLQQVMGYTLNGWPETIREIPEEIQEYFHERGVLSILDGILTHGVRIVIPESMREVLRRTHEGHQGIVKCTLRAKSSVWWPRIYSQIQRLVSACEKCQIDKPSLGTNIW